MPLGREAKRARPEKRGQTYRLVVTVKGPKPEKQFVRFYRALRGAVKPRWVGAKETKPRKPKRPND